jgi:adenylate cyclase
VGRVPAQRILAGQIRRGNVVELEAAILLTDLRGSTQLAVELDEGDYLRMLNRYFDCVVEAVTQSGGEVLKFVGDAVLAVFSGSAGKCDGSHCDDALAAAGAIRAALDDVNARDPVPGGPLRTAMALHEGRLAFGNVGAVARQDFTVIGPDVNLVTRLCSLSGELDEPLLVSERFAARVPRAMRGVGEFPLKGFARSQPVFAPVAFAALAAAPSG